MRWVWAYLCVFGVILCVLGGLVSEGLELAEVGEVWLLGDLLGGRATQGRQTVALYWTMAVRTSSLRAQEGETGREISKCKSMKPIQTMPSSINCCMGREREREREREKKPVKQ